jgi:hypothetical protein
MYENRRVKSVKIVLRSGGEGEGRTMKEVNLRYIVSIYVNITMNLTVQLLYANIIVFKKSFAAGHSASRVTERGLKPALSRHNALSSLFSLLSGTVDLSGMFHKH